MPEFTYTAVTKDGRHETATIQAPTMTAAGHLLKEQGLLLTKIEERGQKSAGSIFQGILRVSLAEKINFVENLSVMLKAGISVSRGLRIQVKQASNPKFKNILSDVAGQVEGGKSLGDALSKYPNIFTNIMISMVHVGEMSGNLEKSLEYLSIQLHREADLKSKTKGAMIYPAVIVIAMFIIGVLMSIFVLPNLTATFKESDVPLPLMTRIVVSFADFMSANALVAVLGICLVATGLIMGLRTPTGKRLTDFIFLRFFVINNIIKKINLARFARILSSLLKSGIPIVQGLEVAGNSLGSYSYGKLVAQAAVDVKLGKPLTESLSKDPRLFPVLVVQMLQVGEESGTTENILEQLAQHYEEEVDSTLSNLSSIIEPLLILFIGGIVGFLAVALISPIYNMGQSIQ